MVYDGLFLSIVHFKVNLTTEYAGLSTKQAMSH